MFQLGDITTISCYTPVVVQSIQWINDSDDVVREGMSVQELALNILTTVSSNNTKYFCRVMEEEFVAESDNITIEVGGNKNKTDLL